MVNKIYKIEGMHCASCAMVITKKLSKLPGILNINVNYGNEKANINFNESAISLDEMNKEIGKFGYSMIGDESIHKDHIDMSAPKKQKEMELINQKSKTDFVLPISIFVFLVMIWDILSKTIIGVPKLPIPMDLLNILMLILSTVVIFWIGRPFVLGVTRFIRYRIANMDTLVGIGTLTAYLYSAIITLFPVVRELLNLPDYTYFDVVIVVIGFVSFGKYLEARSKLRTGEAIEKLMELQAKTALVIRDNEEIEIPISEVVVGDIIIVKPGVKIPVDGKIIGGKTSIDESMITGEGIPVDKGIGDTVIGGTINKQGNIQFQAHKVGKDTMLSQIIKMVENAQGSKAPIEAIADRISGIFVPIVLLVAFISLILWLVIGIPALGQSVAVSYALLSFVSVLVIACPCALGLATPTAMIVGVGKGALNGILIKDAESLEKLNKVDVIVMDKTGTITNGTPEVTDIVILDSSYSKREIYSLAASIEKLSDHPLANAITHCAGRKNIEILKVDNFISEDGVGVRGVINENEVYVRKPLEGDRDQELINLQREGKTVVYVLLDGKKIGMIALSDTVKAGAHESIDKLHKLGIRVVMLTGDNHLAANYIAKQVNVDEVISEVLPNEKLGKIKEIQAEGKIVAMAGDGVNDAPALMQSDVGIAMATGSDIAIESAGLAILHGDIRKISEAIVLSRATIRTVKQNLFWAFIYNVIGIPIAAGLLYPIWGIILNPIFAGLAMALSSVSVVGNSLRLKAKKL